jgi:hypothetical protein
VRQRLIHTRRLERIGARARESQNGGAGAYAVDAACCGLFVTVLPRCSRVDRLNCGPWHSANRSLTRGVTLPHAAHLRAPAASWNLCGDPKLGRWCCQQQLRGTAAAAAAAAAEHVLAAQARHSQRCVCLPRRRRPRVRVCTFRAAALVGGAFLLSGGVTAALRQERKLWLSTHNEWARTRPWRDAAAVCLQSSAPRRLRGAQCWDVALSVTSQHSALTSCCVTRTASRLGCARASTFAVAAASGFVAWSNSPRLKKKASHWPCLLPNITQTAHTTKQHQPTTPPPKTTRGALADHITSPDQQRTAAHRHTHAALHLL